MVASSLGSFNSKELGYTMTAADTQVKEVEKMFAVNVFGPMRMVHIFHPFLIESQGKIINIGSVGGIVPYVYGCKFRNPGRRRKSMSKVFPASYNASKAALHHWGDTLRVEMRPLGQVLVLLG